MFYIFLLSSSEDCDAVLVSVFICTPTDDVIHLQVFENRVREFTAVLILLGKAILQGVLENLNLRAHLENFQKLRYMKVMLCTPQTHTHTRTHRGGALECACVSCGRRGGSRRGHLLFCFRAMVFIFEHAGVSEW